MTRTGERVQAALQELADPITLSTDATGSEIRETAKYKADARGRSTQVRRGLRELEAAGLIAITFDKRGHRTIHLTGPTP